MGSSRITRVIAAVWLALTVILVDTATSARPAIAIVKSSSLVQFDSAMNAAVKSLRAHPMQPEILTFDLEGDPANARRVLDAVRAAAPALIVTIGSLATAVVVRDITNVPVVFSMVLYPEQSEFFSARERLTGASLDIPLDMQFRYLRRVLPEARRVGVLFHASETGALVRAARSAAAKHGFDLVAHEVTDPAAAVNAVAPLLERVEALWTVADGRVLTAQTVPALILATMRRRVPFIGLSAAHVRAGALAALSCDYEDVGVQTAELAARILDGAKPAAVPITTPRRVTLAINTRTADHLGVTLAPDVAAEATVRVP